MYCHWPGLYTHGTKEGFRDFQDVVRALAGRFGDRTAWMKISEIARYQAARELTTVTLEGDGVALPAVSQELDDVGARRRRPGRAQELVHGESLGGLGSRGVLPPQELHVLVQDRQQLRHPGLQFDYTSA